MQLWVIDDTGKVWDGGGHEFRRAHYLSGVEGDICSPLIDNLGFIGVTLHRYDATPIVRFSPRAVTKPALGWLYDWLGRKYHHPVCLAYARPGESVMHHIFGSRLAAVDEMQALIEQVCGPELPFASLPDDLKLLNRVAAFRALLGHWQASGGLFDDAGYRPLLSQFAHNRFSIFAPNASDGALEIVHAGSGLHIPDRQSHAALNGARLEEVAGTFGQWASTAYREVLEHQQPRFDHIYALIPWPRVGSVERRYSRMILPCQTRDGRRLLLGVNCDRNFGPPDLDRKAA